MGPNLKMWLEAGRLGRLHALPFLLALAAACGAVHAAVTPVSCPAGTQQLLINLTCTPFRSYTDASLPTCSTGCSVCGGQPWARVSASTQSLDWELSIGSQLANGSVLVAVLTVVEAGYSLDYSGGGTVAPMDAIIIHFNNTWLSNVSIPAAGVLSGCDTCNSAGGAGATNHDATGRLFPEGWPRAGPSLRFTLTATTHGVSVQVARVVVLACAVPVVPVLFAVAPLASAAPPDDVSPACNITIIGMGFRSSQGAAVNGSLSCKFSTGAVTPATWLNFTAVQCPLPARTPIVNLVSVLTDGGLASCPQPLCVYDAARGPPPTFCDSVEQLVQHTVTVQLAGLCVAAGASSQHIVQCLCILEQSEGGVLTSEDSLLLRVAGNATVTVPALIASVDDNHTAILEFSIMMPPLQSFDAVVTSISFEPCWLKGAPPPVLDLLPTGANVSLPSITSVSLFGSMANATVEISGWQLQLKDGIKLVDAALLGLAVTVPAWPALLSGSTACATLPPEVNITGVTYQPITASSARLLLQLDDLTNSSSVTSKTLVLCYRPAASAVYFLHTGLSVRGAALQSAPSSAFSVRTVTWVVGVSVVGLAALGFLYSIRHFLTRCCHCPVSSSHEKYVHPE